jgi:predicted acetyltransferase
MTAPELRAIHTEEVEAWVASALVPFLEVGNEDALAHWAGHLEEGRTWALVDGGRMVGNCCVFSRDIALPAPGDSLPVVAMAAVSGVGVHPSHRRRGLLTAMMHTMLENAVERGEPFAGLLASEASIYERFGFGIATFGASYAVLTRRSAFTRALEAPAVGLVGTDEAKALLPPCHDEARRRRPGEVSRNAPAWDDEWRDSAFRRRGASVAYRAVTDGGFVTYRVRERTVDGVRSTQAVVCDLYGLTPEIEAALWRFVLDLDLVDEVAAWDRPLDDPLRWWLADARQLRTTGVEDTVWIRPLDVRAILQRRGYFSHGRVVLDVQPAAVVPPGGDPAAGRYVLEAGSGEASCRVARPSEATDITLGVADLGSLLLGGVGASTLAAARRIEAAQPAALAQLDALFRSPLAPFSGTGF